MTDKNDSLTDKILSTIEPELLMDITGTDTPAEECDDVINYPKQGETYSHKDKLTIDIDGKPVTRKLNDWVRFDPVSLHQALVETDFTLTRDNYRILMSSLRANNIEYYRKAVGLEILIDFPGHPQQVAAKSMYDFEPVKFYKWWASNEKKVVMTSREKIQLFLKVESIKAGTLQKKHVEYLKKLRPAGSK